MLESKEKQGKASKSKEKQAKASKNKQKQAKTSKSKQKQGKTRKSKEKQGKTRKNKEKQGKTSKSKGKQGMEKRSGNRHFLCVVLPKLLVIFFALAYLIGGTVLYLVNGELYEQIIKPFGIATIVACAIGIAWSTFGKIYEKHSKEERLDGRK